MPRGSFSHKPLLKVSRPVSACSRCRAAKVKCDGKLPACTSCEKAGRENECTAANDQFAKGKERSYVTALEIRIEKLERRLKYAKARKASVGQHVDEGTTNTSLTEAERRDSLAAIRAAIHRNEELRRETADVNSLVSEFGTLSVTPALRDSMGNVTIAKFVLASTTNEPLPKSTGFVLPSRQDATAIVQYFMAHIYALFPCFSETALLTIVDDVYRQDDRVIGDSDYWLFYLVLAVGSTAQSRSIYDEKYNDGVKFVCQAMAYADQALMPGDVGQIQSLLLLTMYAMLDPAHFDTWHLIGFAFRAVVDLGLHQDPPASSESDESDLDMRRKIFYCTYALDRAISMVHAARFSFADEFINVKFPQSLSSGDRQPASRPVSGPQSVNPASLLFQLRRAQSHWYQVLHQSGRTLLPNPIAFLWQMCLDMRMWQESLPDTLPRGIRQTFELELCYSYVYCLAPSTRAPQTTDYIRTLIFEYSLEYLNSMHEIAHAGLNSAFYTYQDAFKVYFMANQLLAVLRDAQDLLLSGAHVPPPPAYPGFAPPPPMPRRNLRPSVPMGNNLERTIWCLERIPTTLELYGARWEDAIMLKQSFEQSYNGTVDRLRDLRQVPVHNQYQGRVQAISPPPVFHMPGQQAPAGMTWVEGMGWMGLR